ncbi:uncharacterized protein BYT42DRAFT_541868 [Radiomyces spectabilis]|uniref:uncharacterized protein n=1 Tax=Radiomyces spectabilis TaxID=64574 RepID=UPI002220FA87|nr:uncharacterized protein BYT42DRAFT_541868 [Radiomyces spectabilis]KAI8393638.1 hypothetical protein BYT42DRAFT_541868 [Radiomyces spectabilis]
MLRFSRLTNVVKPCQYIGRRSVTSEASASTAGRKYAPGFAAPEGSRETPKIVNKRRNLANSLPSHMGKSDASKKTFTSPKKQHREDLRSLRHQYASELLEKHGRREAAAATKKAQNEERLQQLKATLAKEKHDALEHEAKVVHMLELDLEKEDGKHIDREAQRALNREHHIEKLRAARRKHLVQLYASSESFVTLENVDQRVDDILKQKLGPYSKTLDDMMMTPDADATEIESRKAQLKEVMGL